MNGLATGLPQTLDHRVAVVLKNEGRWGVTYHRRDSLASYHNYVAYDIQEKNEKECANDRKEFIEAEAFGKLNELNLALVSRPQIR
jgi:hypothetical protein